MAMQKLPVITNSKTPIPLKTFSGKIRKTFYILTVNSQKRKRLSTRKEVGVCNGNVILLVKRILKSTKTVLKLKDRQFSTDFCYFFLKQN